MPTFADVLAVARQLAGLTDEQWDASLARSDGRALDALNKATWLVANNLVGVQDPRVEDVDKAEMRTQRLWNRTASERDAAYREALGRVYGGE